jgi:serine/threonine-protein phosphatase 2A regulatory subunit A
MSFALSAVAPTPSLTLARSLPQGVDELSKMGPLDLFKSQMDSGSTEAKVDAMKRLRLVAYAMGTDAAVGSLVPYLQSLALKQPPPEDELLLLLAKQLQTFVPGLLQTPKDILTVVPILERLAAVEETVVRDEAVVGMNHLVSHLTPPGSTGTVEAFVSQSLLSMAKRLVGADWFTAKVSAAGMLPTLYHVTKHTELPNLYKELCMDETPMVRRSASLHLGDFLNKLGAKEKANDLIPVLQGLCKDEQDSVRMLAVASLAKVGDGYAKSPEWTKEFFLPILKEGSTDLSWYVCDLDCDLERLDSGSETKQNKIGQLTLFF